MTAFRTLTARGLAALALTAAAAGLAGAASAAPSVETVAVLAEGPSSYEAIDIGRDGSLYLTSNFDQQIVHVDTSGKVLGHVPLPLHPQVELLTPDGGLVVTAHARIPDFAGRTGDGMPSFKGLGTALLVLDRAGKVTRTFPGPDDSFFNGLTRIAPNVYIVADTIGGSLWKADLNKGTVERWLTDVSVEGPGGKGAFGGSNGLKAHGGWIYYTSRGSLWRVKIGKGDRAEGRPVEFAKIGGDDFTVAADGTIYLPGQKALMKISPTGEISKLIDLGADCPTAMLSPDGKFVYAVTRGGFPGTPNPPPSKLLRIRLE